MYSRIVRSSNPTVLTQYPTARKCVPCRRFSPDWRWVRTALLPFRKPSTTATLYSGGIDRHVRTWSGIVCPLDHVHSFRSAQLLQDRADLPSQVPVQQLLPVLRYNHDVALAL